MKGKARREEDYMCPELPGNGLGFFPFANSQMRIRPCYGCNEEVKLVLVRRHNRGGRACGQVCFDRRVQSPHKLTLVHLRCILRPERSPLELSRVINQTRVPSHEGAPAQFEHQRRTPGNRRRRLDLFLHDKERDSVWWYHHRRGFLFIAHCFGGLVVLRVGHLGQGNSAALPALRR